MSSHSPEIRYEHFKEKTALQHVVEVKSEGLVNSTEFHGIEMAGHWSACADASRETSLFLLLVGLFIHWMDLPWRDMVFFLAAFSLGWLIWKAGRSAWLGWQRLERLDRLRDQESWEIQHRRPQERAELEQLYQAKGFEGQLLQEVVDVLMADDERLLRVMLSEELGLQLESLEHPLKQSLGAAFGCALASTLCLLGLLTCGDPGLLVTALLTMGCSGAVSAYCERNRVVPAFVWNAGLGLLASGTFYFLIQYVPINGVR